MTAEMSNLVAVNRNRSRKDTVFDALIRSPIFRVYERSFSDATGLPIALVPADSWQLAFHGHRKENRFCALMSSRNRSCACCLQVQDRLMNLAAHGAHTVTCPAGLCETAVPVRIGEQLIGFLRTGQVFRHTPSVGEFKKLKGLIKIWGFPADEPELQTTYFKTPVLSSKRQDSLVQLLNIFAHHLSLLANQLSIRSVNAEPPLIANARAFIQEHHTENLSLGRVATAMHTSRFNLCKVFRKATGQNFTLFVSRVRVEKARNLLTNPNLQVSEIAYAVGFQSLTHFNRTFKRCVGESPTRYRARIPRHLLG